MPDKMLNNNKKIVGAITDAPIGTGILAFRDLPRIFDKHIMGKQALDFGCGSGRSSRFLQNLGFTVVGIDSSKDMIDKAIIQDDGVKYHHVKKKNFELFLKKIIKNLILFLSHLY